MTKKNRQIIYDKFGGLCAYTGKPLGDDWQADHVRPVFNHSYYGDETVKHIDNLVPALRIVNHYKRSHNLESFRLYMLSFHNRIAKLPKTTGVQKTINRIAYMQKVAEAFGITPDKPFSGVFYFETLNNSTE